MINLLPSQEKEELKKEEQFKVILILGIIIFASLVSFSLILSSINIFLSGEVDSQKIIYTQRKKELKNPEIQTFQANLTDFNKKISQLDSFYQNQVAFTEILEKISGTIPPEISILSSSLSLEEKTIKCSLAGFSPDREVLIQFRDTLEKEEGFTEIYIPPACWTKPKDINFTANFNIKAE